MAHREVHNKLIGSRAPTAINGLSDQLFHPVDKTNANADYLEHQFTPHALCEENHKRYVEARVQALLEAEDNDPPPPH
jgi:hypothetical protein